MTIARENIAPIERKGGRSVTASAHEGHGHSHDIPGVGQFMLRPPKVTRDYEERCYTVGIGGPVGAGKSTLILQLCRRLKERVELGVVTNDIFTKEDWEFLVRKKALANERLSAVETGGCPHAAIREDVTMNLLETVKLTEEQGIELCIIESGGDNLAANFSRDLADYIIYVVDVAGGDKVPRKGGPGVTQSDLLVINKTDLAVAVGADLDLMYSQALHMRDDGPTVKCNSKIGDVGVDSVVDHILVAFLAATGKTCKPGNKVAN